MQCFKLLLNYHKVCCRSSVSIGFFLKEKSILLRWTDFVMGRAQKNRNCKEIVEHRLNLLYERFTYTSPRSASRG